MLMFICFFTATCHSEMMGLNTLTINFDDANDAKAKAAWSHGLDLNTKGLGWKGKEGSTRDYWVRTIELATGLYWRPTCFAAITVDINVVPQSSPANIDQSRTMSPVHVFVRHSPDTKHWSSWQLMPSTAIKDSKCHSTGFIEIPNMDQEKYTRYLMEYQRLDVPWASDEEAGVKWILQRDPNFFATSLPFIGYIQVLCEGSNEGFRFSKLTITAQWSSGGLHISPKNHDMSYIDDMTPWRYRADKPAQNLQSRSECKVEISSKAAYLKAKIVL